MNKFLTALLVLVVVGGVLLIVFRIGNKEATSPPAPVASAHTFTTSQGVMISYGNSYGLATSLEQVPVKSYIPPCDQSFDYCLYRTGIEYARTNFESAGLRVKSRADLSSQTTCLSVPPNGYTAFTPKTETRTGYATSVFAPLGDAGAGHYAAGALYRLFAGGKCTEFETRIGETQYANYSLGTIEKFTDANRAAVASELRSMLDSVIIGNTKVIFPAL